MADPFATIDKTIASAAPATTTAAPAADPFATIDENMQGNVEKTNIPAKIAEPPVAAPTPEPEPTATPQTEPVYNPPASLPVTNAPGQKPFASLPDISKPDLMHPQLKGYFPNMTGTAPQYGEGIREGVKPGDVPLYKNAMKDLSDFGQGTNRLLNSAVERSREALPEVIGGEGRGPDQLDMDALKGVVKGTGDYYKDRYIKPFAEGGLVNGYEAMEQQWMAHPLSVLDVAGGGMSNAFEGALNLAGTAGRVASRAPHPTGFKPVASGVLGPSNYSAIKPTYNLQGHVQKLGNQAMQGMNDLWEGINAKPSDPSRFSKKVLNPIKGMTSKVMLQSPLQIPWQLMQNGITAALTHVNSPADVIYAMTGMMLASTKMRKWIPDEFFSAAAPQTLSQLPKWLQHLTLPDRLMNKHLEWVGMQDDYWRAASAMTQAVKEVAGVTSPKELKTLLDIIQLSYAGKRHIKQIMNNPAMTEKFLKEVHRTLGNYGKEFGAVENALDKNIMFYRALRHLSILSASFPIHHPIKTSVINALSTTINKMAESEPMNARVREAGAVMVRDKNGQLKIGPQGGYLVYQKGAGLTPFMTGITGGQFMVKMLNREDLGDTQLPFSLAPQWNFLADRGLGVNMGAGMAPFKDPESIKGEGGTQIKRDKLERSDAGEYTIDPQNDYVKNPARPLEASIGDTFAPSVYNPILKVLAQHEHPGAMPSDFSTLGNSVPQRNPDGTIKKGMPTTLASWAFSKLQPNEMGFDLDAEEGYNQYRLGKAMKKYKRQAANWEE